MRLFIGLWPDQAAADALAGWARDARTQCGGRVMQTPDLHLTLAFLGKVAEADAGRLVRAVTSWPLALKPFVLDCFGTFAKARVVWAGPGDPADQAMLQGLHDAVWSGLQDLGWPAPQRGFTPHVSLLRKATTTTVDGLHRPPVTCRPARCVLVQSQPGAGASHYRVLAHLPVTHDAAPGGPRT